MINWNQTGNVMSFENDSKQELKPVSLNILVFAQLMKIIL